MRVSARYHNPALAWLPAGAEEGYDAYGYNAAGEPATSFATGFEPATGFEAAAAPGGFETAAAPPAPLEYAAAPVQVRLARVVAVFLALWRACMSVWPSVACGPWFEPGGWGAQEGKSPGSNPQHMGRMPALLLLVWCFFPRPLIWASSVHHFCCYLLVGSAGSFYLKRRTFAKLLRTQG
jgi:hypothetical protein